MMPLGKSPNKMSEGLTSSLGLLGMSSAMVLCRGIGLQSSGLRVSCGRGSQSRNAVTGFRMAALSSARAAASSSCAFSLLDDRIGCLEKRLRSGGPSKILSKVRSLVRGGGKSGTEGADSYPSTVAPRADARASSKASKSC